MLDAKKILDSFLGSGGRTGGFGGASGASGSNDLANVIGGALSKIGGSSTPARPGSPSGDLGGPLGGNLGGIAGGAIAGTLASVLLGGKKKSLPMSGSAMKLGGLAILGGLAYKAWQNYQQTNQAPPTTAPLPQAGPVQVAPPPQETAFAPSNSSEEEKLGLLLVRAMIAAARADGHIDGAEIAKIREALKAANADGDEQAFLIEHLGKPDDLDAIAAEARGPELASEVWLAARLAIDPDAPAERQFLETFAQKLGLGAPLVAHLEATAAQAKLGGVEMR